MSVVTTILTDLQRIELAFPATRCRMCSTTAPIPPILAQALYKARARIEQGIGRLKRFERVAL